MLSSRASTRTLRGACAVSFSSKWIDSGAEAIHAGRLCDVGVQSGQAASITGFSISRLFDRLLTGGDLSAFSTLASATPAYQRASRRLHDQPRHRAGRDEQPIYYQDGKLYDLATGVLFGVPYGIRR